MVNTSDIQEINWGNFRAKFADNEQSTFEWLCYLLFCEEYNQPLGISRYENHAGIETNPITIGEDIIGWQAKFYDTPMSKHKSDLIASIDTAKRRHPELTTIVFYTNLDFGQDNKKTDPPYKIAIEKHGKSKGVSIIWKTKNFFKSPFVAKTNAVIAKHFFSLGKSTIDLVEELNNHSSLVLSPIQSGIHFAGKELKIDRSSVTAIVSQNLRDGVPVILSGEGGVGKTAVVKDLYSSVNGKIPLFVFKAIQFNNTTDVNSLVNCYGDFLINDLADAYPDVAEKCIVIDSAEKLSDIEDKEVFNTFLTIFIQYKWKLIFTTRHSYLDDLRNMLVSLYGLAFQTQDIKKITYEELVNLSQTHNFTLPNDKRLQDLICNPFYLNEYLQNYDDIKKDLTYSDFKNTLWDKKIANTSFTKDRTHVKREECFISLAQKRANEGNFFVKGDGLDLAILQKLIDDEIVGYEKDSRGYFITHDIYEEWALERFIESTFRLRGESEDFYKDLGSSLPVRRAFRHWLTDKLFIDKNIVKSLVETSISNAAIESYWQDEVLVSVLLSEHSKNLLELFEEQMLVDEAKLLVRITFLLRIACKEIDETTIRNLGFRRTTGIAIETLFTKPKGSGWNYVIDFINRSKEKLGLMNINVILALLEDWNAKNKQGTTTKSASLIALFYYEKATEYGGFGRRDELGKNIIKVILSGSHEIKQELSTIVDAVVAQGKLNHRDKYYDVSTAMLSSVIESSEVAQAVPEKVISLAQVLWLGKDDDDDDYRSHPIDIGQYFGMPMLHHEYFPSSPYQTPTLILLRTSPDLAIDFILLLTNQTVEYYKKSSLSENEIQEVQIFADDTKHRVQYLSSRLWEMYRGTHVAPSVLESVYMALEKWLLEIAKTSTSAELEKRCLYLFKNSKSASLTSIIVSIILAHPFKLFNVAIMIFRTKEFFLYDTARYVKDRTHKSMLEGLRDNYPQRDYLAKFYQDERIVACDDKHRGGSLENAAWYYQFYKSDEETDKQARKRVDILWKIFDEYYSKLPQPSKETNADKTWRLYLARMDKRKMKPKREEINGQSVISFNPDLDTELKKYSEDSLKRNNEAMAFAPLSVWAQARWVRNEGKYKEYKNYEDEPLIALQELKKLFQVLKYENQDMGLFYRATPVYVCATLVRDFRAKLNKKDFSFCETILIDHASLPVKDIYKYSIGDGIEASIGSLPYLFTTTSNKPRIKKLLLFLLFDDFPIGMGGDRLKDFPATIILHHFWKINSADAHSIFLGFLLLKPIYEELIDEVRQDNFKKNVYEHTKKQVFKLLQKRHKTEIDSVLSNTIIYAQLKNLQTTELDILYTAFELLPPQTQNKDHLEFLKLVLPIFAQKLSDEERNGYTLSHSFLKKFAYFVLNASDDEIEEYIKPFIENFDKFEYTSDLFSNFVTVEDEIHQYEQFWKVWQLFYASVVKMSKKERQPHRANSIIHNYLLAWQYWKETAKQWISLKDREKAFFKKATNDMGHHPAVLYSISKFLNEIGSSFIDDGIVWLSDMLEKNPNLSSDELEVNTVFYMENIVRNFAIRKRREIKRNPVLKKRMITILDFLVEKASVTAYLVREDIL
jgi:hypothetical protein